MVLIKRPSERVVAGPEPYRWHCLTAPETDTPLESDDTLVRRAQAGDREAFAALAERHWPLLYRWLYHLTHHQHAAEDLVQEAFLKAYTGLKSYRAGSHFRAWLYRIAYNSFVNQWREEGRTRQPFPDQLPDPGQGPAEQVMSQEGLRQLARAVGRLPPEFRAAFLLRVEEQCCRSARSPAS